MTIKRYTCQNSKNSPFNKMPTRTGKTVTATELANNYIKRVEKEKALFLKHA